MENSINYVKYDLKDLELYKKKKVNLHFVKSLNVKEKGEPIVIHTLEGDVTISADEEKYIMIGLHNDIYPIPRELFEAKYQVIDDINVQKLDEVMKAHDIDVSKVEGCQLVKDSYVYACKVEKDFAVYTRHCDSILYGKSGDYYAATYEDSENVYIIRGDIMEETYEKTLMIV